MNDLKERIKRKLANKQRLNRREQEKYTSMCRSAEGVRKAHGGLKNKPEMVVAASGEIVAVATGTLAAELKDERERKERLAFIEAQGWRQVSGRWRTSKGLFVKKADLEKAGLA